MSETNTSFDFDQVIDRTKSNSAKWDNKVLEKRFGDPDLLPLWVTTTMNVFSGMIPCC